MQLHTDAQVEHREFRGHVEHIVSYQATHFHSLKALTAFMVQTMITLQQADDTDESR